MFSLKGHYFLQPYVRDAMSQELYWDLSDRSLYVKHFDLNEYYYSILVKRMQQWLLNN